MVGAAATVILLLQSGTTTAGLFGLGYSGCGPQACNSCGDFASAKAGCGAQYRNVQDVVYDQQQYTTYQTTYDTCTEQVPVPILSLIHI